METAITPEVVGGETQILEDSPMTPSEQRRLVELETRIKTKLGNKMEADLAIGSALLQIQREKLYRSSIGGRKFEDYIKEESHRLTPDGRAISEKTATHLRGFYYFREEVLPHSRNLCSGNESLPLPTAASQVRPLLFLLDHLRRDSSEIRSGGTYDDRRAAEAKAIEIWKAAVSDAKGKVPTFEQVNHARLSDEAAEQHRLRGRADTAPPRRQPDPPPNTINPEGFDFPNSPPASTPPPSPTVAAWELERDDSALDAATECRKLHDALGAAYQAVSRLRGYLFNQTAKYGSDYLGFLRQVDAGVYSVTDIDSQVELIREDINAIADILTADVGPGELARSTLDVSAVPTR